MCKCRFSSVYRFSSWFSCMGFHDQGDSYIQFECPVVAKKIKDRRTHKGVRENGAESISQQHKGGKGRVYVSCL